MGNLHRFQLRNLTPLNIFILFFYTSFCIIIFFIWEGHLGINLSDESFLWYGSAATSQGQVPIRDFYAYDPGRYYFTALIMKLQGNNGIIASRVAETLVQGLGLFLALFILVRGMKFDKKYNYIFLILTTLTLLIWMVPLYKSFDITASIILITALTYLIETNTLVAYFLTGLLVGMIAIIGRNHGVYGLLASFGLIIYLSFTTHLHPLLKVLKYWLIGLWAGYTPILLMLWLIPGFKPAFQKSILDLIMSKSTNLHIPVPWPWQALNFSGLITGIFFVAILLFSSFSLSYLIFKSKNKKMSSVLIACAFLSIPYAHYVFSRADVIHLVLGIFPLLLGSFAYLYQVCSKPNIIILFNIIILLILSSIVVLPLHPGVQSHLDKDWQNIEITGSELKVDPNSKINIDMFKRLINQYAPNDQSFLVTPFNFGMYSIFKRASPMWDLYPLFLRSLDDQLNDIDRIKKSNPSFVVIYDYALDGDEKRQFHNTHAYIFKFIKENFELIHDVAETENEYIYKRKTKNY